MHKNGKSARKVRLVAFYFQASKKQQAIGKTRSEKYQDIEQMIESLHQIRF